MYAPATTWLGVCEHEAPTHLRFTSNQLDPTCLVRLSRAALPLFPSHTVAEIGLNSL